LPSVLYRYPAGGFPAIISLFVRVGTGVLLVVIKTPRWLSAGVDRVMGWPALFADGVIFSSLPPGVIAWSALGGLLLNPGAGVYINKEPNSIPEVFRFPETWRIFAIPGSFGHHAALLGYIDPA
jgi:channel protein (hemolysin III family)